jgi:L-fucose mutarotase
MLKNIDPLLSPQLLHILCEMGHGDEIVVADANFTAMSLAAGKPVIRLPGTTVARACQAVLSVFPLDEHVDEPVAFMQVSGSAKGYTSAVQRDVLALLKAQPDTTHVKATATERFAFYERVRGAYAIIQTGDLQPYANFLFKKGVIADPLVP